jgi:hypothetical protein
MNNEFDFTPFSAGMVYVKPISVASLPQEMQDQVGPRDIVFAVHDADGTRLALVADRRLAFALAVQNDKRPQAVH